VSTLLHAIVRRLFTQFAEFLVLLCPVMLFVLYASKPNFFTAFQKSIPSFLMHD
jgi:hypothetical protein